MFTLVVSMPTLLRDVGMAPGSNSCLLAEQLLGKSLFFAGFQC